MMESEMDEHIGYEKYQHSDTTNYRNDIKKKNTLILCQAGINIGRF